MPVAETYGPMPSGAAPAGSLVGVVLGEYRGDPLEGVQVYVDGAGRGAVTGARGEFRLDSLAPGAATLVWRRIGYATRQAAVVFAPGQGYMAALALPATSAVVCTHHSLRTPGVAVRVRVIPSGAAPSAGATLVVRQGHARDSAAGRPVAADSALWLEVRELPSGGPVHLTVRSPGYREWRAGRVRIPPGPCGGHDTRVLHAWLAPGG